MLVAQRDRCHRPGVSLLEVLVALTIFLVSLIAIGQMLTQSGDLALEIQQQSQALQLCQSKLAEVVAGAVPVVQDSGGNFEEEPDWEWSVKSDADSIPNLYRVEVRVSRKRDDDTRIECVLQQMVLDPAQRGSTAENTQISSSSGQTDSSSTSTGSSSTTGGQTSGGGSTSSSGGASKPPSTSSSPGTTSGSSPPSTTTRPPSGTQSPSSNPSPSQGSRSSSPRVLPSSGSNGDRR